MNGLLVFWMAQQGGSTAPPPVAVDWIRIVVTLGLSVALNVAAWRIAPKPNRADM